jgi:hypothetical protein
MNTDKEKNTNDSRPSRRIANILISAKVRIRKGDILSPKGPVRFYRLVPLPKDSSPFLLDRWQ